MTTQATDPPRSGTSSAGASTMSERLENLLTIIDTGLNVLSPDELLKEMLDRVRTVLEADTASVLLIDESGENLIAHAAHGLEEEVRQGFHVPVGVGFAGSIAARRSPAAIDHVGPDTVSNPLLWEKGLRTMLGAPMMRDEHVIGVLHVGRLREQVFNGEERELLLVAADRVAGAVTAQHLVAEAAAANLLERSLLPSRFPKVPGVELAGRYAAAAARTIGGDWYDAFTLPTGELWLVIGDVIGHGLRSAVVMGRVRSALRAYALLGGSPAHVLELTDRKVHHFEMGRMTTAVCAVSAPPYDTFEISCAGHPAPILAAPGVDAVLVEVDSNPPLGAVPDVRRTSVTVDVPLGSVLTLYTDGLVERKDASIDEGMDRARQTVSCDHPEVVCRNLMSRMVGNSVPEDDIAVLVMRHIATHNSSDDMLDPEPRITTPPAIGGKPA